jgi:heme-degrading monooxygenase HmoA
VVRFESAETLERWRTDPRHLAMQERGRTEFYDEYEITVAEVSRSHRYPPAPAAA